MLKILNASAQACGVKPASLFKSGRDELAFIARQVAFFIIRDKCGCSISHIGRTLKLNIGTINHSIKTMEDRINLDDKHARDLQKKVAETLEAVAVGRKVVIEVFCGVAFVKSKPQDVDVEIITKP